MVKKMQNDAVALLSVQMQQQDKDIKELTRNISRIDTELKMQTGQLKEINDKLDRFREKEKGNEERIEKIESSFSFFQKHGKTFFIIISLVFIAGVIFDDVHTIKDLFGIIRG